MSNVAVISVAVDSHVKDLFCDLRKPERHASFDCDILSLNQPARYVSCIWLMLSCKAVKCIKKGDLA